MSNITVEFVGVKTEIPIEGLTFEALEQMVFDISRAQAQQALTGAIVKYDNLLRKTRERSLLKNLGLRKKKMQTLAGDIIYQRTLYRDKNGDKVYLLDEALKLSRNQRMSLKLIELFGVLANMGPYRAAQESLSKLTGLFRSHENIRLNVIKEGKRIEDRRNNEIKKIKALDYTLPQELPEVVYTEADATYIRKQNRGKKSGVKHLEVKIGIGYAGKEPRYKKGSLAAQKLTRRFILAGIKDSRNEFLDKLSCKAEEVYGLSLVQKSYFGSDGDTWLRTGRDEYFSRSKHLLCVFHLFERLRQAFCRNRQAQAGIKKLFTLGKIDQALEQITLAVNTSVDEKQTEALKDFYGYVANNRQGIEASMSLRLDKAVKTAGAIEPNIDKTIAHRFKGRGLSWSEDGAQALLKIRETILNGEWDNWWYKQRGQKLQIKALFKEPLTSTVMNRKQNVAPFIEAQLPCWRGPDQSKPWVDVLRRLSQARLPA